MKIKLCLMVAVLMSIGNILYAANGDLLVNGNLGVGTTSPNARLDIRGPGIVDGMINSMGYVDLAKGITPTISSGGLSNGGPTFRGSFSCWSPTSYPSSLIIDLNPAALDTQIMYICFGSSWRPYSAYLPKNYSIDYSDDGTNWNSLVSVQNFSGSYVMHKTNALKARYIRLNILAPQTGSVVYIAGLQVLSVQGSTMYGDNPWAPRNSDVIFAAAGNIGIGTTSPSYKVDVAGTIASNGSPLTSDIRFKKNIEPIADALTKILKMNGMSFEWKTEEYIDKGFEKGRHFGVIAQDVERILPEIVNSRQDGSKNVAYTEIIPILIEAIKEQNKQIEQLKSKVEELQSRDHS